MSVHKALTIAGSDSGGGAGIQADLKTFQEYGVFGTTAITAITAQNTLGVHDVSPVPAEMLEQQLKAVLDDIGTDAAKTGMLFDTDWIEVTASFVKKASFPVVVDPVMVATSGHALLKEKAEQTLVETLFPHAALVTPNIPEAERLTGRSAGSLQARKDMARELLSYGPGAVLLKGGHDPEAETLTDILFDGAEFHFLHVPKLDTTHTHGTGCTYAAAITAGLAQGKSMRDAVYRAKQFIHQAIDGAVPIGSGDGPVWHAAHRTAEAPPVTMEVERE
ncbi:bifunctional hydroxymethylpyrimidine kinase/phosphomethylpyrimidine kinase [Alkalicoccus chagannorensis]|uniref:bifunctional hydroxymethylpyrimidine kinase/phosphomethylpyrimidine kinase n=1 Tax=Alkalicoccus chagannorensis TaxID=427072 RepID=UPI00042A4211|nr:bifunctional hydroxymethylpyrimidine kinase/phosphomethylpyrimidine kinase [Alkalicoccus chagannorensis]